MSALLPFAYVVEIAAGVIAAYISTRSIAAAYLAKEKLRGFFKSQEFNREELDELLLKISEKESLGKAAMYAAIFSHAVGQVIQAKLSEKERFAVVDALTQPTDRSRRQFIEDVAPKELVDS